MVEIKKLFRLIRDSAEIVSCLIRLWITFIVLLGIAAVDSAGVLALGWFVTNVFSENPTWEIRGNVFDPHLAAVCLLVFFILRFLIILGGQYIASRLMYAGLPILRVRLLRRFWDFDRAELSEHGFLFDLHNRTAIFLKAIVYGSSAIIIEISTTAVLVIALILSVGASVLIVGLPVMALIFVNLKLIGSRLRKLGLSQAKHNSECLDFASDLIALPPATLDTRAKDFLTSVFGRLSTRYSIDVSLIRMFSAVPKLSVELIIVFAMGLLVMLQLNTGLSELGGYLAVMLLRLGMGMGSLLTAINRIIVAAESIRVIVSHKHSIVVPLTNDAGEEDNNAINSTKFENCGKFKLELSDGIYIKSGEWVRLTGISGSGKSRFLRSVIARQADLVVEDLDYLPESVDDRPFTADEMPLLATGGQGDIFIKNLSLAENICLESEHSIDKDCLELLMEMTGLRDLFLRRKINVYQPIADLHNQLSGGELQRIFLARVLYRQPAFVLLDEVFSNLDPTSVEAIASKIRLKFPNLGVLLVGHGSHYDNLCDRSLSIQEL